MALSLRACVSCAASRVIRPLLAFAGVMALAGCGPDGQPNLNAAQPRGASVAFESIDGPPPDKFRKLVDNLNEEAQTRRLAVASRESPTAYRVRGYLAVKVAKGETTVSWVWDVFDGDQHRALRIAGEESVKGRHHNAWSIADDAMLHRIASSSMDQLAAFLTAPDVAPGTPAPSFPAATPVALLGQHDPSPEAAGIFRIVEPRADPMPEATGASAESTGAVPLPRRRPAAAKAAGPEMSARGTVTLAESR